MKQPEPSPNPPPEPALRAWRTIMGLLLPVALGAAAALALQVWVVLPSLGLGNLERIAALGHLTAEPFPPESVVALGNSVTAEGLDAAIAEQSANAPDRPPLRVWNCALSGCGINEQRVIMPRVLAAKPKVVILGLQPEQMGYMDNINLDKCYAYAYGGFPANWPADWKLFHFPELTPTTYDALRSTRWQQTIHFRNQPLIQLNESLRRRGLGGFRNTPANNWRNPYEMEFSLPHDDPRLDQNFANLKAFKKRFLDDASAKRQRSAITREITNMISAAGARPVLVLLPIHPKMRAEYDNVWPEFQKLCGELQLETGARIADASELLTAADFADAVHPNAAGRKKYSEFLGHLLREVR